MSPQMIRIASLWSLNIEATDDIYIARRKALWMLWGLHPISHCDIIAGLSNLISLDMLSKEISRS